MWKATKPASTLPLWKSLRPAHPSPARTLVVPTPSPTLKPSKLPAAAASPGERRATLEIRLLFADGDERVLSFARDDAEGTREAWLGPDRAVVRFSAATSALLSKSLRALEERR